jgi:hypothetical protein
MDDIALRLGWVAINAARVEVLLSYLQVALGSEEAATVGAPWSTNYRTCKSKYRAMYGQAVERGDTYEAENNQLFHGLLVELNTWMEDRHHVLHAIWEQDPDLDPGNTLGLRREGRRISGQWPVERLDALNRYLTDCHKMIMAEMTHQIARREAGGAPRTTNVEPG